MKKSIKSVLAKSLAVAMAFSLAGIAPSTSSDAATKKPTVTKKVTVKVGKTKTVKVTSKKKVKKTTWSLTKKGKKIVSLSKKKAKSVKIKGKKAGKATLTAKIKVGKKTYKKTCKITVKKADVVKSSTPTQSAGAVASPTASSGSTGGNGTPTPSAGSNATPVPTPTPVPVGEFTVDGTTVTVDEDATYNIPITSLNETTFTSEDKRSDGKTCTEGTVYNRDGSVSFTSKADYNSGVSYYINPCTSEDDIVDISDTRGDGFYGYKKAEKDMSAYDYIRLEVTSENEMNVRTYNGDNFNSLGFTGNPDSETYEGGWAHTVATDEIWEKDAAHAQGKTVKSDYVRRTVFIPIASNLIEKGTDPSKLTAIAFCPQSAGVEVTIHRIDFVKVNYDTKVTGITVTAKKTQLAAGKVTTCTAAITPEKATRQIVKWSSSDEELATVNYQGAVVAGSTKEGTVTITAEATDGSGVKGTVTIQIGGTAQTTATPPADEGAPTIADNGDATLTLAANEIKASTNNGSNTITDNIEKTDDGIVYKGGYKMQMLDISEYLEKYNLDLGNYTSIEITGKLLDAEGNELKCGSGKAKTQLVTKANLNGFADGMAGGYKAFPTIDIDISAVEATDLAGAVGFNIQLNPDTSDEEWTAALAKYTTMVITSIKLNGASSVTPPGPEDPDDPGNDDPNEPVVSGNETSLVLAADEIVASSNGTTGNIEKTKDGILYKDAKTMQKLDISAYLEKYELDLSDYASIEITGKLLDENGDEVTCADGKIKTALVNKDNLNGYSDGYNTRKFKQFPTISVDISDIEATDLAQAVGFNLQVDDDWFKGDGSAYTTMLITSIKLIKAE